FALDSLRPSEASGFLWLAGVVVGDNRKRNRLMRTLFGNTIKLIQTNAQKGGGHKIERLLHSSAADILVVGEPGLVPDTFLSFSVDFAKLVFPNLLVIWKTSVVGYVHHTELFSHPESKGDVRIVKMVFFVEGLLLNLLAAYAPVHRVT